MKKILLLVLLSVFVCSLSACGAYRREQIQEHREDIREERQDRRKDIFEERQERREEIWENRY